MDVSVKGGMTRALSETDLRDLSVPKKKPYAHMFGGLSVEDEEKEEQESIMEKGYNGNFPRTVSFGGGLLSFSEVEEECEIGGGGGGSGKCDFGGSGFGFGDSNHGNDSVDVYYQTMIEANPGDSLLLSNYAKYLKEVCVRFSVLCFLM